VTATAQPISRATFAIERVTQALTDLASLRALMYESTGRTMSWIRESPDEEFAGALLRMSPMKRPTHDGHMKRLGERCQADPAFRTFPREHPGDAAARLRLDLDSAEAAAIANPETPRSGVPMSVRRVPAWCCRIGLTTQGMRFAWPNVS